MESLTNKTDVGAEPLEEAERLSREWERDYRRYPRPVGEEHR